MLQLVFALFFTGDLSTNCWWVAAVSFGEGWHNAHHAVSLYMSATEATGWCHSSQFISMAFAPACASNQPQPYTTPMAGEQAHR